LGQTNEVSLPFSITTPGLALQGNLAFLKLTASNTDVPLNASDRTTKPTHFDGTFSLDFTDGPDAGTRLTVGEIGSMGITPILNATPEINLKLNFDFGSAQFPSLGAYLNVGWDFTNSPAATTTPASSFGGVPSVGFNNITLGLGSFLSKFASPI